MQQNSTLQTQNGEVAVHGGRFIPPDHQRALTKCTDLLQQLITVQHLCTALLKHCSCHQVLLFQCSSLEGAMLQLESFVGLNPRPK